MERPPFPFMTMRGLALLLFLLETAFPAVSRAQSQQFPSLPSWVVGQPAPYFYAYDEKGVAHSLAELKGKWVLFDSSAAWCFPSLQLAERAKVVKDYLATKGITLATYTLVDQNPLGTPNAGRADALAWKLEFPFSDIVVGHHVGFTDLLYSLPELYNLLGSPFNRKGWPTWCLVDPQGIVTYIRQPNRDDPVAELTADEILAKILPGEPPLTTLVPEPNLSFFNPPVAPEITVSVGEKWGRSRHPRVTPLGGGAFSVPYLEQGTLSHEHGIGFGRQTMPQGELVTLMYDTYLATGPDDHGLPLDKKIYFRLHIPRYSGARPIITQTSALVLVHDYVIARSTRREAPLKVVGNHVIIGPVDVSGTSYPPRAVDVQFTVYTPNSALLAAQGGDATLGLTEVTTNKAAPILRAQWLAVENAANLPPSLNGNFLLRSALAHLRSKIVHASAADVSQPQREAWMRMVQEMQLRAIHDWMQLRRGK